MIDSDLDVAVEALIEDFACVDPTATGVVSAREFHAVLRRHGGFDDQVAAIAGKFTLTGGSVDYAAFIEHLAAVRKDVSPPRVEAFGWTAQQSPSPPPTAYAAPLPSPAPWPSPSPSRASASCSPPFAAARVVARALQAAASHVNLPQTPPRPRGAQVPAEVVVSPMTPAASASASPSSRHALPSPQPSPAAPSPGNAASPTGPPPPHPPTPTSRTVSASSPPPRQPRLSPSVGDAVPRAPRWSPAASTYRHVDPASPRAAPLQAPLDTIFSALDVAHTGRIRPSELAASLHRYGLDVDLAAVQHIARELHVPQFTRGNFAAVVARLPPHVAFALRDPGLWDQPALPTGATDATEGAAKAARQEQRRGPLYMQPTVNVLIRRSVSRPNSVAGLHASRSRSAAHSPPDVTSARPHVRAVDVTPVLQPQPARPADPREVRVSLTAPQPSAAVARRVQTATRASAAPTGSSLVASPPVAAYWEAAPFEAACGPHASAVMSLAAAVAARRGTTGWLPPPRLVEVVLTAAPDAPRAAVVAAVRALPPRHDGCVSYTALVACLLAASTPERRRPATAATPGDSPCPQPRAVAPTQTLPPGAAARPTHIHHALADELLRVVGPAAVDSLEAYFSFATGNSSCRVGVVPVACVRVALAGLYRDAEVACPEWVVTRATRVAQAPFAAVSSRTAVPVGAVDLREARRAALRWMATHVGSRSADWADAGYLIADLRAAAV